MQPSLDLPAITMLATAAGRCGCDLNAVLEELGIGVNSDSAVFQRLPLPVLAQLIDSLERRATRGHFPFVLADTFSFEGQPAVSAFLASAQNLREANLVLDWASSLIHPAFRFERADNGVEAPLLIHVDDPDAHYTDHPAIVELIMAVVARISHLLAPDTEVFTEVHFAHAERTAQTVYAQCFGCPPRFGMPDNRIVFVSQVLDGRLPGSLPVAHAQAEEAIRRKLLGDGVAPPVSLLVEAMLKQRLELFGQGIDAIAAVLRLHPRTLQRRLRAEGQTFADLISKVRHQLACDMLRSSELDIESIGIKLGYAERRSFTQAFHKWHGQTPSDYRKASRRGR
jgi:AraC-like DNA-binding protein